MLKTAIEFSKKRLESLEEAVRNKKKAQKAKKIKQG
jgi:hypothetical protein